MKILLAQPSIKRFQWELEVLLNNLKQFGNFEVVLLFAKHDDSVPQYLYEKYGAQSFVYQDARFDKSYIPSIRPYLLWQYFKSHPEAENEMYLYIDADIIFREWPDFATSAFNDNTVYGADCSSYIDYDYIQKCTKGDAICTKMAEICGITTDQMKGVPGIGAQIVLPNTTAAFWERAYHDSNAIYRYLLPLETNIQKWTAEMWAQQWGWVREGKKLEIWDDLNFSRPTDPIEKWDEFKIMHNAGVTSPGSMFFKGQYVETMPFDEDFSYIDPNKVSAKYVEAIKSVVF